MKMIEEKKLPSRHNHFPGSHYHRHSCIPHLHLQQWKHSGLKMEEEGEDRLSSPSTSRGFSELPNLLLASAEADEEPSDALLLDADADDALRGGRCSTNESEESSISRCLLRERVL